MNNRSFGGRRPSRFGSRGNNFGRRGNGQRDQRIDVSKFINKNIEEDSVLEIAVKNRFENFALDQRIKLNVEKKGFDKPTPIQDQAIPHILLGKDLVGIANTGTGKTLAFLLPMLHKLIKNVNQKVLILTPTRELAMQIQEEFEIFSRGLGFRSVLCIGGANIGRQLSDLKRYHHFVIGTPGRIKDLTQRQALKLHGFQNVIIDEADRMLDMGFINDIKELLALLPRERHSLFFSATISREIEGLINTFLRDPITVSVKVRETAASVFQDVIHVSKDNRIDVLKDLLSKEEFMKVMIFGRTKYGVEKLTNVLTRYGFKASSIHGNKSLSQRYTALKNFKDNRIQVLVATDVAARGLDIKNVSHVINYDLPATYDDYIHRIGRTGHADKRGVALTFVSKD